MTDTLHDTTELQALVDGYFECWNTADPLARRAAVERVWAPDARCVDPVADVRGHEELSAMFAGFHETYPGYSFRQRGGIDAHHEMLRWGWEMLDAAGEVALAGIDAAIVADAKLGYLVGFFGTDVPEA